jgi:hypothetical protein
VIFAFTEDDRWVPGIGDPTVVGWVTVFAYFVAAVLAWRAAHAAYRRAGEMDGATWFWSLFCAGLVFLGFNKQLDLQTWFTLFFKRQALHEGWYNSRRPVQAAFILVVALAGILCLAGLRSLVRTGTRPVRVALVGGVFLGCFILIRASSFHHVDSMLGMNFEGFKLNWVLELGSITCIAYAAWMGPRFAPPPSEEGGQDFIWVSRGDRLQPPPGG